MYNICHITSAHPRYDIRIFVKECITLAKAKHQVSLIVADAQLDEVNSGVEIYSVGKPESRRERMYRIPQKIYAKIIQLNPDIVHFHDPELIFMGLKLARQGFKVVYDVHEDLPKQVLNKHWIPKLVRPLISRLVSFLESYCAKKFYGIIAATPIIAERFYCYNDYTRVVCNYPLLSELDSIVVNWLNREDKVCYIGSISQIRGIIPIVKSLAQSKVILELAGQFSGDISLVELQALPGGDYINYLGVVDRKQITSLLQNVRVGLVTLLPTPSYVESLPIKMFEYMLAGIPVVASNFQLWQDIIDKYHCGILVNPSDSNAIADACKWLLTNPEQACQMGENGRKAVLELFNWEKESIQLLEFYQ